MPNRPELYLNHDRMADHQITTVNPHFHWATPGFGGNLRQTTKTEGSCVLPYSLLSDVNCPLDLKQHNTLQ